MSALTGSLIMFQYPLSLILLYTMILLRFVSCLVPQRGSIERSWGKYARDSLKTVVWITLVCSGLIFFMFGTLLDQARWQPDKVQEMSSSMLRAIILDYQCVGSRIWPTLAAVVVPNLLILAKILTN